MDDNISSPSQPTSTNQPPQGVQTPTPNVTQPTPTTPTTFQRPTMNQQPEMVQQAVEEKPKSGKKRILLVLGGLILLLVVVVVGLFVTLTPTVKGLSVCMEENSRNMDAMFQRGLAEKWTNQQKCQEFKPETEKLISCYESVGNDSLLPEQLAFNLGGLIRGKEIKVDKEGMIQLHNSNCSQFPETLISD